MTAARGDSPRWAERHTWKAPVATRTAWLLAFAAVAFFVPMLADRWAYDHLHMADVYDRDWGRFLRELGWFPTWIAVSLGMWLATRRAATAGAASPDATTEAVAMRASPRAAAYLFTAPAVSGIVCEILKLLIRRERPETGAGDYVFRAWSERTFSTAGLATPSSHTMVSFAAATALARIFPGTGGLWYLLATGTAITRVLAHAHFVSDVALGALLGWSVGWGVCIAFQGRAARAGPATPHA
ncbi:MAG TPA: phosphatase PAP2 family protein [Gemmatimonadaceae bacterium]|nr:phosphatase PAP2 family protein [Gemmatimonadaceae bacterium]